MRFTVRHETLYRYDVPVELGPHVVRLTPRPSSVVLLSRALVVRPTPFERFDFLDAHGNEVTRLTFAGATNELFVESAFEADTLDARSARPPEPIDLGPYLANPDEDPSVRAFAADVAASASEPLWFLRALTGTIHAMMDRGIRHEGAARSAAETLALRTGACRDLTALFLAACRSQGIAARFVSGYQAQAQTPDGRRHLHAWAEAFVPEVGWSAWDPMHGVEVTTGHVPLCAAPSQAETMPLDGTYTFYGPTLNSTLDFAVNIATS
jgi:transglutaminase-like putative cysteine protease